MCWLWKHFQISQERTILQKTRWTSEASKEAPLTSWTNEANTAPLKSDGCCLASCNHWRRVRTASFGATPVRTASWALLIQQITPHMIITVRWRCFGRLSTQILALMWPKVPSACAVVSQTRLESLVDVLKSAKVWCRLLVGVLGNLGVGCLGWCRRAIQDALVRLSLQATGQSCHHEVSWFPWQQCA